MTLSKVWTWKCHHSSVGEDSPLSLFRCDCRPTMRSHPIGQRPGPLVHTHHHGGHTFPGTRHRGGQHVCPGTCVAETGGPASMNGPLGSVNKQGDCVDCSGNFSPLARPAAGPWPSVTGSHRGHPLVLRPLHHSGGRLRGMLTIATRDSHRCAECSALEDSAQLLQSPSHINNNTVIITHTCFAPSGHCLWSRLLPHTNARC